MQQCKSGVMGNLPNSIMPIGNIPLAASKHVICNNGFIGNKTPINGLSAFIFEVKTAGADTFQLPFELSGTYDCNVDDGNGNVVHITQWDHADTLLSYPGAGTYIVKITGICYGWRFANSGDKDLLFDIKSWGLGVFRLGNNGSYFYGCGQLTVSATDILDLTGTTSLLLAFQACGNLVLIPSINYWDFSEVLNMQRAFAGSIKFNQKLILNSINVTNFSVMVYQCFAYDQDSGGLNISSTTTMELFATGTTMTTENLSNTYIGLNAQSHQNNVKFDGGSATYNLAGAIARLGLTGDGWIITDDGPE